MAIIEYSESNFTLDELKLLLVGLNRVGAPELYCPFISTVHGAAVETQEQSVEWARTVGLASDPRRLAKLREAKIAWLACRAFPTARRIPLQLAADWTTLFCLLDDRTEKIGDPVQLGRYLASLVVVFQGRVRPHAGDVIGEAFEDLGRRIRAEAPRCWVDGFVSRLDELFRAFCAEAANRSLGIIPNLENYKKIREITVGLYVEFEFGELTDGIEVPSYVRAHPTFKSLVTMASNIVGWANDIYTYEKEILQGEIHNIVIVAMRAFGLSLEQAIEWAIDHHDEEVRNFEALLENLPSFDADADRELQAYASMLVSWVRGHLDWAHETGRYVTADGAPPSSQRWTSYVTSRRRSSVLPPPGEPAILPRSSVAPPASPPTFPPLSGPISSIPPQSR